MKLLITALLIMFYSSMPHPAFSQSGKNTYLYYDSAWTQIKEKKAVFLVRLHNTEEGFLQYAYYKMLGPLMRIETFQDSHAKIREGLSAWYSPSGVMDSSGYYSHGLPDGLWIYLDQKARVRRFKEYDKGILLKERVIPEKDDSIKYNPNDTRLAQFPGGLGAWLRYLNKNLRYPDRAMSNEIQGEVRVHFIVDSLGQTSDLRVIRSVEMSIDDETLRMIYNSSQWIPGVIDGEKVKSYKIQPIVFKMDTEPAKRKT